MRVFDDRLRQLRAHPYGLGRVARVDEDDRVALIELGPYGLKVLMAEMLAVIRSKELDPISLELVKYTFDNSSCALDAQEARQCTEESESVRLMARYWM